MAQLVSGGATPTKEEKRTKKDWHAGLSNGLSCREKPRKKPKNIRRKKWAGRVRLISSFDKVETKGKGSGQLTELALAYHVRMEEGKRKKANT